MDLTANNWMDISVPALCLVREKGIEGIAENPVRSATITQISINRDFFFDQRHLEWYATKDYDLIEELVPTINPIPTP